MKGNDMNDYLFKMNPTIENELNKLSNDYYDAVGPLLKLLNNNEAAARDFCAMVHLFVNFGEKMDSVIDSIFALCLHIGDLYYERYSEEMPFIIDSARHVAHNIK